jgi:LuxR family maltose regulon positive regulatory protein
VASHDVNNFPIQASKVRCPVPRDQTLARDRLLEWLQAKIHHRLVLVTAEAGYGKTTLLADFARRTRLRTIWYSLDETDRDWVTVLNHLVAAGRAVDPAFGSATWSLLGELGTGGAPLSAIVASYVRDLHNLGEHGAALVLDDYHLVEDVPDIQYIVREIVTHAPDRLAVVIASRRAPVLPTARLRTLGEVAELTKAELRFDASETERLFRETYGRPLEADVLSELTLRTQGWVASLQLVQSALRERTMAEARSFVRSLSGARGTLHDYLAEEVVGDLDTRLQTFIMRTSILSDLELETASFIAGVAPEEARVHLDAAARVGLLPRADEAGPARYHPLVRDFLEDRLRREIGDGGLADLHRAVARHGETRDWKLAAHHYAAAGDSEDVRRVLVASMQDIMGTGGFALAESYVHRYPDFESDPTFGLFLSRRDLYNGRFDRAVARAEAAVAAFPPESGDHLSHLAIANLSSVQYSTGDIDSAVAHANVLYGLQPDRELRDIADGMLAMSRESLEGNLIESAAVLGRALLSQVERGHDHYAGITYLNLASNLLAQGKAAEALTHATEALALLSATSGGFEIPTARVLRAWAFHHLGRTEEGDAELELALATKGPDRRQVTVECADIEASYGDPERARRMLESSDEITRSTWHEDDLAALVLCSLAHTPSDLGIAQSSFSRIDPGQLRATPAFAGRWSLAAATLAHRGMGDATLHVREADRILRKQRADHWLKCVEILGAINAEDEAKLGVVLSRIIEQDPVYATICADDLATALGSLSPVHAGIVRAEARSRPRRWRPVLRRILEEGGAASSLGAATILDEVGDREDVGRLRAFARASKSPGSSSLGKALARRLAPIAHVQDQGHVILRIGDRTIDGSLVRRKVLSLVCFLMTRPGFTATRDQVLEALWPDLDPGVAVNSLNQTVYFLRRVLEPGYREDESANYVSHDGEVVRLDPALVASQSTDCLRLIEEARTSLEPDAVERLSVAYTGRFAIDFEYDDWASPFRETLHAAYLDVIEQAIHQDTASGRFGRAGLIARRAISVDPEAGSVEIALLRIYRNAGSHSAAAEQYSHYAAQAEDEGFEPTPISAL